jgi:hypothetical protein
MGMKYETYRKTEKTSKDFIGNPEGKRQNERDMAK